MIVLDYLIANEDRHLNDFGVVRNANTLDYIGQAPIFDSGTAMWFDKPTAMAGETNRLVCKPFKTTHEEQLKLVQSFDWLSMEKLNGIEEEFRELVSGSLFIDEARCDALCKALSKRKKALEQIMNIQRKIYAAMTVRMMSLRTLLTVVPAVIRRGRCDNASLLFCSLCKKNNHLCQTSI